MAFLDRDGVRIYYEDHGKGPAVLLSHGYGATTEMWQGQIQAFKDRYRIIVWDMRGHGQSDYPDDQALYTEAATVGDMHAILKARGVQRAVIAGLSLGGYSSLAFHLAHPEMVRALMLFDTGPGFRKDDAREAWNERARERAQAFDTQGLAAQSTSEERRISTHRNAKGLARAARGMLTQRDARVLESLGRIAVPTLVLAGANDTNFLAAIDYMAAKIPQATKVIIPDAGHASNLNQPEAFNRAVDSFLSGLPAR
ncbi:MAG: alpha/beta fold hydrolase [Candidatus Lambdaproteobacteria bacterium]|nr:alpha/beta fold hydrolase [Candidatus Lambdaproteobacteria bacterium]